MAQQNDSTTDRVRVGHKMICVSILILATAMGGCGVIGETPPRYYYEILIENPNGGMDDIYQDIGGYTETLLQSEGDPCTQSPNTLWYILEVKNNEIRRTHLIQCVGGFFVVEILAD